MTSSTEPGALTPSIPGPYRSPEQTEAFPLKQSLYGSSSGKGRKWKLLTGCCGASDKGGTSLRIIVMCFVLLTIAVMVALAIQIYYGAYQLVPHGSVATDHHQCSIVGTDILKKGGNAVDAAIAATLCMGVVNPHVTGLGSGGFMIIYNHRKRKVMDVIDFREMAPAFVSVSKTLPGSTVGVPGLLRGLSLAHENYGKLPWEQLVMPAVNLARYGFPVLNSLEEVKSHLLPVSNVSGLFQLLAGLQSGQYFRLPNLAATLELIATKGADVFYNGSIAANIVETVNSFGGNMTVEDLASYKAIHRQAAEETFADFNVIVPDLPSGGQALLDILKLLPELNSTFATHGRIAPSVVNMVDASEQTYKSILQGIWGDPNFDTKQPEGGDIDPTVNFAKVAGSHISAVDLNDIYVSIVSGLNTWLGSQLVINKSFILNNALINFGVGKNKPSPGKRPISYATPVIAVEKRRVCGRRLVFGSADATIAMQLLMRLIVLDSDINKSIEAPRFHLENVNKAVYLEGLLNPLLNDSINIQDLQNYSYQLKNLQKPYQSSNIVHKFGDELGSHSDSRGGGVASRF